MQQLDKKPKQKRAELATLLGARSGADGVTKRPIHGHPTTHRVIQLHQQIQEQTMDPKLLAPFQQQVPPHPVKRLLEINKHHVQPLPVVLGRLDKVLQGEDGIQSAMAWPETTLCGGA
jgi:hypothetical protein